MRTKIITLEAFEDRELGVVGLGIHGLSRDLDFSAATEGLVIAHDLLEHQNGIKQIGSIEDELEALGGIWFVRGQWGDLRRDNIGSAHTIHENIAADITRMFRDFFNGTPVNTNPIRTMPTDADDDLKHIIECAVKDMPGEVQQDVEEGEEEAFKEKLAAYTSICLPRMRIGYRKAAKKWRNYRSDMANALFWEIAETLDPYCKHVDEGHEFELRYGIDRDGRAWAKCREKEMDDYGRFL